MKNDLYLSIIIPTIDRGPFMIDTVQQLKKQLYRKYEIIIVDQSSSYDLDIQNQIDELLDSKTRYFRVSPRCGLACFDYWY